ncbi:hypothetical protein BLOT_009799, partial [Blomia tropicalis]
NKFSRPLSIQVESLLSFTVSQQCIFCQTVTSHPSSNCMATSLKMKWKLIESTDICCRCLRGYHKPSECISKIKCKRCRRLHATIMCKIDPVLTINHNLKCLRCGTEGHVGAVCTVSAPVFNSLNMTQSYSGVHFLDSVSSAHYQTKNVQSCHITSKIGSQSLFGHPSEAVLK